MVCTADDLQEWKDFPKGLRVLLLDRDSRSATEIRAKLEEMEHVVYYCNDEKEALSAIMNTPENFHIAILEMCEGNYDESFKLLGSSKDLPIIMTSDVYCLSTMMKCIALGAVEFLLKPLSEDKLRNIWQHVLHKAFSSTPKPEVDSAASLMQLQLESEDNNGVLEDTEGLSWIQDIVWEQEQPEGNVNSQLNQGSSMQGCWESGDQMNCPMETDCSDKDVQSNFVETTSHDLVCEDTLQERQPRLSGNNKCGVKSGPSAAEHSIQGSDVNPSAGSKSKKTKVDWSPELHRKFIQAVEQLGIDRAIPSKILELMKVEGLTRHNVASHLQKYRMQRKHVMQREENLTRYSMQTNHSPPIMAYPSYPYCGISMSTVYRTWTQTNGHPANVNMRGPPDYRHWPQPGTQPWNSYAGMQADAWGCPVMLPSRAPYFSYPQQISASHNVYTANKGYGTPQISFDLQPNEELIDEIVNEAKRKPWSPLPLGLKPPSAEILVEELPKQGISTLTPQINAFNPP
ncbi:two-component response regulator-like APRR2 isoform X2 [Cucurbita maxima]|uniref:Two-component response regulator-like APRR2 isoform X2 n=1 Tax=Cucurbita maxima TaxID=3661 RepID=A0A6J1K8K9_CUCMA|nr:two-component response regulator-like APRR2 isoform X2 [Cucurbita maxima]